MPEENNLELWVEVGDRHSIRYLGRGTAKGLIAAAARLPQNYQGHCLICDDSGLFPHFYRIPARKEAQSR